MEQRGREGGRVYEKKIYKFKVIIERKLNLMKAVQGVKMGQEDMFDFLRERPNRWFTSKEIAKALNLSKGSVTCNLKKLRKSRAISFEPDESSGGRGFFRYCYDVNLIKKIPRGSKNMET